MLDLTINGKSIPLDKEGYLLNPDDWSREVAVALAKIDNLQLTEDHWEVIHWVRSFWDNYGKSPSIRPLVNYLKHNLGPEKGNSIFLATLFPAGVAKQATKLAGLPKPARCT